MVTVALCPARVTSGKFPRVSDTVKVTVTSLLTIARLLSALSDVMLMLLKVGAVLSKTTEDPSVTEVISVATFPAISIKLIPNGTELSFKSLPVVVYKAS